MRTLRYVLPDVAVFVLFFACSAAIFAAPRQEVIAVLDEIPNAYPESTLKVRVNDGGRDTFVLGDEIRFHFTAETGGYVGLAYVDSHGEPKVMFPDSCAPNGRLVAKTPCTYPSAVQPPFEAEPPLGTEHIYVVLTEKPIDRRKLGDPVPSRPSIYADPANPLRLAEGFRTAVMEAARSGAAESVRIKLSIESSPGKTEYTTRGLKTQLTTQTRSLDRRPLPAHINFERSSAILSDQGKLDLDVWGDALLDPLLIGKRYAVAGHTCDLGSDAFNLDLSRQRAQAAKEYLVQSFGIEPGRLVVKAYGESRPTRPNVDEAARVENRRVEFELLDR